jgi:hypothetical protein
VAAQHRLLTRCPLPPQTNQRSGIVTLATCRGPPFCAAHTCKIETNTLWCDCVPTFLLMACPMSANCVEPRSWYVLQGTPLHALSWLPGGSRLQFASHSVISFSMPRGFLSWPVQDRACTVTSLFDVDASVASRLRFVPRSECCLPQTIQASSFPSIKNRA